jgi:gas vesicle protein
MSTRPRSPQWWSDQHTSAWDRVKEAFQRDWEQTKADFSSHGGQELNQNVADTVKQAVGSAPVPPVGVKTHDPSPTDAAKEAAKANVDAAKEAAKASVEAAKANAEIGVQKAKLDETVSDVHEDLAKSAQKAQEKIAKARQDAAEDIQKKHEKVAEANARRDGAVAKWQAAEQEARYGYAARSHHSTYRDWNDELEGRLRSEWDQLGTGRQWSDARTGVRRGWDYAGRKH